MERRSSGSGRKESDSDSYGVPPLSQADNLRTRCLPFVIEFVFTYLYEYNLTIKVGILLILVSLTIDVNIILFENIKDPKFLLICVDFLCSGVCL